MSNLLFTRRRPLLLIESKASDNRSFSMCHFWELRVKYLIVKYLIIYYLFETNTLIYLERRLVS